MNVFLTATIFAALALPLWAEGERLPFPQHTAYAPGTSLPRRDRAAMDEAVLSFYRAWKKRYLKPAGRGQLCVFANAEKTFEPPSVRSVSEAHGYGMIAAVLMAGADPEAREDFDALYRYFRAHPALARPDLMAWRQFKKASLSKPEDRNTATDGDLDIAFALLLAERQWGGGGPIDYGAQARKVITAILAAETDPERLTLRLGNWAGEESEMRGALRSSDFMPGHLKAFARATGEPRWEKIAANTYSLFAALTRQYSPNSGLLPDFIVPHEGGGYAPAGPKFLEGKHDGQYAYNACRVPWRVGVDAALHGDARAFALLAPLNAWVRKATGGDPAKINAGYRLDGTPLGADRSAAFTAPFAVAAMADPSAPAWLDALWDELTRRGIEEETYYGNTIKLLTLIVLSGNWWEPQ